MKFTTTAFSGTGGKIEGASAQLADGYYTLRNRKKKNLGFNLIQRQQQSNFAQIMHTWRFGLTSAQQNSWYAWAAAYGYPNGLPPHPNLWGQNWFYRRTQINNAFGSGNPNEMGAPTSGTPLMPTITAINLRNVGAPFNIIRADIYAVWDQVVSPLGAIIICTCSSFQSKNYRYPTKLPYIGGTGFQQYPPGVPWSVLDIGILQIEYPQQIGTQWPFAYLGYDDPNLGYRQYITATVIS